MNWTTPADVSAQVLRLWEKGELLAELASGDVGASGFPRKLSLNKPSSTEIAERFGEVDAWIRALRALPHVRLETREIRHRVHGLNALIDAIWLDHPEDALALIGKTREAARFRAILELSRAQQPAWLPWLARRPLSALELADQWPRFLAIATWLKAHPRPGLYLRQVDIPGVHSKFIETHRSILAELLDLALPPSAIEPSATGVGQFARRYGFREKPVRIRFRLLDPGHALLPGKVGRDITLDAESFARLEPTVSRVFITENEVNFLALPEVPHSLAIFGAGYGFEALAQADWLSRCRILYWGDLDTHGFAILDELRGHFPHTTSFLMDRATLMAFQSQWGEEDRPTCRDLPRLSAEELSLYDDLRDQRLKKNLRLEQEKIGFAWVESALSAL